MWNWIKKANELSEKGEIFLIATVISNSGSTPRGAGTKILICKDGSFYGTIGGGAIENGVLKDAPSFFKTEKSKTITYKLTPKEDQLCGGEMEVFFEIIGASPSLYIFGAGHVGQALCNVMANTPFKVHLVDERSDWIFSKNLPEEIIKHAEKWNTFIKKSNWSKEKTYVAIMTPGHALDQEILEEVLKHDFKYLGLMGSKNKWGEIKENILKKGLTESDILKVNCPIGLNIGGKSPKEIAISIASEIIKKYNARI
jgi:xanthine dehydrogenase accessory factor